MVTCPQTQKSRKKPHDFVIYSHLISGCVYQSSNRVNFLRTVINRGTRNCSLTIQLFEIFSKHTDVKTGFVHVILLPLI